MFVADGGIAIWIIGLLLVGLLGFGVVLFSLIFKFLAWLLRSLVKIVAPRRPAHCALDDATRRTICPHADCGRANGPTALYCGRCGRRLR